MQYTRPEISSCARCLTVVLRCLSGGLPTTTDTTPLTLTGQIHALQQHRPLFELLIRGGRVNSEIVHRDKTRIASGKPHIALAEHKCGTNWEAYRDPEATRRFEQWRNPPRRVTDPNEPPPF